MTDRHAGLSVELDELSKAVLLDVLNNVAKMLERGADPLQVAQQIRGFVANVERVT
jgi:hypothetical protein